MFLEIIVLTIGIVFFGFIATMPRGQRTGTAPEEVQKWKH